MRVLAVNGSPRMKASSTYHMLRPFLEGMKRAGAETELIHIRQLELKPCIGCYACWVRTPGVCIHQDSMGAAIEAYNRADLVVYGTPVYHFSMPGLMKTFIDRLLPRLEPWLIPHPTLLGRTGHPARSRGPTKMFLVSACGFPEFDNFEPLIHTFQHMARMQGMLYTGEILRPFAEALSRESLQPLFSAYYNLLGLAGEELVKDGLISSQLEAELHRDLFPGGKEMAYQLAADYWNDQMNRFRVPEEKRHTVPLPSSDWDVIRGDQTHLESGLSLTQPREGSPEALIHKLASQYAENVHTIRGLEATIQWVFPPAPPSSDRAPENWYLCIRDGNCTARRGRTPIPTLTITSPCEVWSDIVAGRIDSVEAFAEGRYEADGAMQLLAELPHLFGFRREGQVEIAPVLATGPSAPSTVAGTKGTNVERASFRDTMAGMAAAFDPAAAGNLQADIQFRVTGAEPGNYFLHIENRVCTFHEGLATSPTLTIHTPSDVWMAISRGELQGKQALFDGKYRVEGDFAVLMKLDQLFRER